MDGFLYDAFISYSHSADSRVAPALRDGLHRFAKPWYKLRATRIFHDDASMITDISLWDAIQKNLQASQHFIFLASPASAASIWVQKEIRWWLENRTHETMLIVLTEGELAWDAEAADFDWQTTTAFPGEIPHGLKDEPLWLDLRWIRAAEDLTLRNPEIRKAIADLSSVLTGRPKDELIGEDVRRHRQTRRVAWGAAAGLAALAATSTVAAVFAVLNQREAEDRSRLALSRQIATQSAAALDAGALDRALLLALESGKALDGMNAAVPADDHDARAALITSMHALPNLGRYLVHARNVSSVQTSAAGYLVARVDGALRFWKTEGFEPVDVPPIPEPSKDLVLESFSPVVGILANGLSGPVGLFDPKAGRFIGSIDTGQGGALYHPVVSPDGRTMAVGAGDNSVFLWRAGTPVSRAKRLRGHTSNVVGLAFSPDGSLLASSSWDTTVRIWNVETGRQIGPPLPHRGQVESVAFSPDGSVLVTGSGGAVRMFDTKTFEQMKVRIPNVGSADDVAIHPDGSILYVAGASHARIGRFRLPDGIPLPPLVGHLDSISSMAVDPGGAFLATSGRSGEIIIWRDPTGDGRVAVDVGEYSASNIAIAPDQRSGAVESCVAGGKKPCEKRRITTWRLERESNGVLRLSKAARADAGSSARNLALSYRRDGTLVSVNCAETRSSSCIGLSIRHRDSDLAEIGPHQLLEPDSEIGGVLLMKDASQAAFNVIARRTGGSFSAQRQPYLRISDISTGERILDADPKMPNAAQGLRANSNAGFILDGGVVVNLEDGSLAYELPDSRSAITPDGKSIITLVDPLYGAASVRVWDSTDGSPRSVTATSLVGNLVRVAISPDQRSMIITDADGNVALWDLAARSQLGAPLHLSEEGIFGIDFADHGNVLLLMGRDGTLMAIDLDLPVMRERACALVGRNLTYEEWTGLFGDRAYERTCTGNPVNPSVKSAGLQLAEAGDIDAALTLLERARELGDTSIDDPVQAAREMAAEGARSRGDAAADAGGYDAALKAYQQAVEFGIDMPQTPEERASLRAAKFYQDRGTVFARANEPVLAVTAFERALEINARTEIQEFEWARLCTGALMQNQIDIAGRACIAAHENSDGKRNYYDLLALHQILTGRFAEAEISFDAFFEFEKQEMRFRGDRRLPFATLERVENWRVAMREGRLDDIDASLADYLKGRVSNF